MRLLRWASTAVLIEAVTAASLSDVCSTSYVQAHLPAQGFYTGITIDASSVTASTVSNYSSAASDFFPAATLSFCSVSFSYSHDGKNDSVVVSYWLPAPSDFKNRYLSTGGGGFAINSGNGSLPGGVQYGAVAGYTDGGKSLAVITRV